MSRSTAGKAVSSTGGGRLGGSSPGTRCKTTTASTVFDDQLTASSPGAVTSSVPMGSSAMTCIRAFARAKCSCSDGRRATGDGRLIVLFG